MLMISLAADQAIAARTAMPGAVANAAAPQTAAPARTPPPATRRVTRLDVALLLNGSPAGDVPIETAADGSTSVDVTQLVARLAPAVTQPLRDELIARAAGRAFVPIDELRSPRFPISFDMASLQLRVDVPVDARSINQLSLSGAARGEQADVAAPSNFAFGVSLTIADRLVSEGVFRDLQRDPFNIAAQGFVNIGGKSGAYLTFLGGLQEGGRPFRQRTTLFHDNEARAIRYSLGDVDPLTSGSFANPLALAGIGVERLYQTIQPYRNLRPAGRGGLALDRPSRVEVYVNGAIYRTLSLGAGRYSLRDFPFLDGLNDVRLVVSDDTGRTETIGLSFFSDTELLDQNISIFSATAGFRRDRFGQFSSTRYGGDPIFSGLYQVGVTDRLTLGGSIQADPRNAFASALAVVGTPIGIFGAEAALDLRSGESPRGALLLNYRLARTGASGRQTRLDLDFQLRSDGFSPLETAAGVRDPYAYDVAARFQQALRFDIFATVTAGYSKGRAGRPDLTTGSAGLSRSFGRINVSAGYTYRDDGVRREHRGSVGLSVPISRRQYARASYDTSRNRVGLDYTLQGYEGLDQTTAQVSLAREDGARGASAQVEHFANRFRALLQHDYDRRDGLTSQTTNLAVTTGLGYADGQWAIGRDPGRGFVMVAKHASLRSADLIVSDQYSLGPAAKTGALGPALVPVQRQYQGNSLVVAAPEAPPGYDLGAGRLDVRPGAASGYRWLVGSDASFTVTGKVVDAKGAPVAFLAGTLRSLSGRADRAAGTAVTIAFFTNRTGRLVAQNLAPGRYAIVPSDANKPIAEVEIKTDSTNPIDIGTIVVKD